jgi:ankyrin repeat protein
MSKPKKTDKRIDQSFLDIIEKNNKAVKKLFLEVGIDAVDRDGRTLLLNASCYKNAALIRWAINNGADVNHQDNGGWTALHFAVQENALAIVNLLLDNNIRVDSKDEHGNTPLFHAIISNGNPGIILSLLKKGADLKKRNKYRVAPKDLLRSDSAKNRKIKDLVLTYLR